MKNQKHVVLINVDFNKKFFTNHGLHKNSQGKEKIAHLIAYNCRKFFVRKLRFLILLIGSIFMMIFLIIKLLVLEKLDLIMYPLE